MFTALTVFLFFFIVHLEGSTSPEHRQLSYVRHLEMQKNSLFKNLKWRYCGPLFISGRVTDIEAYPHNPNQFYVGSASGGVWFTGDRGKSWRCVFDRESSISVGDIAISQTEKGIIWVGTGEANSSRSSYAGTGIFKSLDHGKTWRNMGLTDTHHIGRILIHPENPDIVYVAALGHLYSENSQRGVFMTRDGGRTWRKILFIDNRTGCIDLVIHPENPLVLYAAVWEKQRRAWNFVEAGENSGIYKTHDGGVNWRKLGNGFPDNRHVGRIGLAISRSDPRVVYALLDNQEPRPEKIKSGISIEMVEAMGIQGFLDLENEKLNLFLKENRAPAIYDAIMVKGLVRSGKITPRGIARIFSDAQQQRLNPYVKGAEVYRSEDDGGSWEKVNQCYLENMYLTYGFFFGQIRVSPENSRTVYILGIPIQKSVDGGHTFKNITGPPAGLGKEMVHRDSHALWINPRNARELILGTDGGLNLSRDGGGSWQKVSNLPISQCYTIEYDFRQPFLIYCGLQDNGVVMGPAPGTGNKPVPGWEMIWGGDGGYVCIPRSNSHLVFLESQFGFVHRLDFRTRTRKNIQPQPPENRIAYRFNWLTPFLISRHQPDTLLLGANYVLKSTDGGDSWNEVSPELVKERAISGNIPFQTITALDESPLSPRILTAGTDEGSLWITKNSGETWERIDTMLPDKWVSRVVLSRYDPNRLYVTLTGYREDDFKTYIFATDNYGTDWMSLKNNLPDEPVNVLREDPFRRNTIYVGTDLGVYVSFNRGGEWHSLKCNLPTVPVYDLKIHPREKTVLLATHGRGVYCLPLGDIHRYQETHDTSGQKTH